MNGMTPLSAIPEEQIVELVERLDVRGPRYTSYPTAPVWTGDFPADPYVQALEKLVEKKRPAAVYVHLPFCHMRCLYCGCNSFISNNMPRITSHTKVIEKEIRKAGEVFRGQLQHGWLHLGGGTPTHVPAPDLADLLDMLLETIPGAPDAERSVEVDPRVTTDEHLRLLADRGFRRISIGLQDLDPAVQKAVQRVFSFEQMRDFIQRAHDAGFDGVNVDLIYGLPLQTRDTWRRTLEQVATLRPNRIATFGYAHLPKKIKHQRAIRSEDLPGSRDRLGMLLDAQRMFVDDGYVSIGLDHFAVPGDKLAVARQQGSLWRNFMGYTDIRGLEMIGFGASAIGELDDLFAQNITAPSAYEETVLAGNWATTRGHKLDLDDRIRKQMINDLMCNLRVRIPDAARENGLASLDNLEAAVAGLAPYQEEGLILPSDNGGWTVTPLGQLFLRNLAMPFDRYLPDQAGVTFSRTV